MGNTTTSHGNSVSKNAYSNQADWKCLSTTALRNWKSNVTQDFSFDNKGEWLYQNLKISRNIWSGYVVKGSDVSGKQQVICQLDAKTINTKVCAKTSKWINNISILAFNNDVIVVQVVMTKSVKLLLVNLKTAFVLGAYTFSFVKEACVQECLVSGDSKFMLCRQDFLQRRALGHVDLFDPDIRIIQIKDGYCKRIRIIKDGLAFGVKGSGLAFDPRYVHGRFSVFSSQYQSIGQRHLHTSNENSECDKVFTYDLSSSSVVTLAKSAPSQVIHHIKYSTDGKLIAAVCVDLYLYITCTFKLNGILLYCSDTLNVIRSIDITNVPCKPQILSRFPMFSRSSELMAYYEGSKHKVVRVIKLPDCTRNLQDKCRLVIRRQVKRTDVFQLPLPEKLKYYLAFLEY